MSTAGPKTRRDPRVSSQGLDLHYRGTAGEWRSAKVVDLSLGGSLIACAVDPDVFMGCKLALIIERRSDGARVEVSAEVLRVSDREGAGRRAALRFIELSQRSAATLATVLSEPIDDGGEQPEGDDGSDGEGEGGPVTEIIGPMVGGQPLTTLRMHKCSLYELLSIDPACDENTLAGHGEALIFTVTDELQRAVGRREQRLQVLFNSVVRMRPLWNDQIKRARYDLRWGVLRVEERLADADNGTGVNAQILAAIWQDLYPERVRDAERVMIRARTDGIATCLRRAIELDPFNRRRRQRLSLLESAANADMMPLPRRAGAPQTVRGSLVDLPLHSILRAVAEEEDDVEVVVHVDGIAQGVVGIAKGELVTAIAGDARGVAALRVLNEIVDGTFQARYAPPRQHLRHIRAIALEALEEALDEHVT